MYRSDMPEKLYYITEQQLETTDFQQATTFTENLLKGETPFVSQQRDIEDFEPKEWFTNTSNYDYFYEFLQGLALIDQFDTSEDCIYKIIDFNDDFTQFQNNVTVETLYTAPDDKRYVYPYLNFTGMISDQFSFIPIYCYQFLFIEVYDWWNALYKSMEYDFNFLLISFLFT